MVEVLLTILLFVVVIAIAAVLFAGWMAVMVLRAGANMVAAIGRLAARGASTSQRMIQGNRVRHVKCDNEQCRATNPADARFCRRCGQPMRKAVQVFARRAAIF